MYKAKSIVDNKFWILETADGNKVGTVGVTGSRVTVNISNTPETFSTIDEFLGKYDVTFGKKLAEAKPSNALEVYGYPSKTKPHNALWNVQLKLPIYTKTEKSDSYHCAGHYIIRFGNGWVKSFSPKLLTLEKYDFRGPFMTNQEAAQEARKANETA